MTDDPAIRRRLDEPPVSLWRDAWHRLMRNRLAVVGLVVVADPRLRGDLRPVADAL